MSTSVVFTSTYVRMNSKNTNADVVKYIDITAYVVNIYIESSVDIVTTNIDIHF